MFQSFNARAVGLASLPALDTIEVAAEAGFEGVDLMIRDLADAGDDPLALRARMDDLGLRAGAFPLPVAWKGDEAAFRRDLADLPRLAASAAQLGLTRTATCVLPETSRRTDDASDRAAHRAEVVAFHRERLGDIARILDDHGIRIGLEFIGVESSRTGRGDPFVTRTADLFRDLGTIFDDHPNVGLLVDVFHFYAAADPIEEALALGVDRIVRVHVDDLPASHPGTRADIVDAERGLPGESGAVSNRSTLRALALASYGGAVTAEPLALCETLIGLDPGVIAARVKEALDRCWPD